MLFLVSFFLLSVEEEEEDEEMAEAKPGLESEQQDDEDSREPKEGTAPGPPPPTSIAKHAHLCVTLHPGRSRIRWRRGGGSSYQPSGMSGSALIKNLSLDPS